MERFRKFLSANALMLSSQLIATDQLLGILRNAYVQSHSYEKEGRHSVINVTPELNKIKVTLYSVKNDTDDILTEVYFDEDFFDEEG